MGKKKDWHVAKLSNSLPSIGLCKVLNEIWRLEMIGEKKGCGGEYVKAMMKRGFGWVSTF